MKRFAAVAILGLGLALLSPTPPARGAECRGFDLSVVVDGAALPEYWWRNRTYVEALKGRPFSLRISNSTGGRIAVALSVDGRNVIDARRSSASAARKWVLSAGQAIEIPGWQISGETARRFFFTETAHSYANWLGDTANVGTIEAVFFRERPARPRPLIDGSEPISPQRDDKAASGEPDRQGPSSETAAAAPQAQGKAQAPSGSDAFSQRRGIRGAQSRDPESFASTGIGEPTRFEVQRVVFDEDPIPAARVTLRYEFRPELVSLGVLPRADDLSARDHARGFDSEYAPDPDRPR